MQELSALEEVGPPPLSPQRQPQWLQQLPPALLWSASEEPAGGNAEGPDVECSGTTAEAEEPGAEVELIAKAKTISSTAKEITA